MMDHALEPARHPAGQPVVRAGLQRSADGDYNNGGTVTEPASWLVNLNDGGKTVAGVAIDEWVAEGMPAVYACVHAISETVGQLPLKLFKKSEGVAGSRRHHPLYMILHDLPNPEMTAFQFREVMTRHLAMWGRAYAFIQRDDERGSDRAVADPSASGEGEARRAEPQGVHRDDGDGEQEPYPTTRIGRRFCTCT
jgi:hypothetical protein